MDRGVRQLRHGVRDQCIVVDEKSNARRALAKRLPICRVFAVAPLTSRLRRRCGLLIVALPNTIYNLGSTCGPFSSTLFRAKA